MTSAFRSDNSVRCVPPDRIVIQQLEDLLLEAVSLMEASSEASGETATAHWLVKARAVLYETLTGTPCTKNHWEQ